MSDEMEPLDPLVYASVVFEQYAAQQGPQYSYPRMVVNPVTNTMLTISPAEFRAATSSSETRPTLKPIQKLPRVEHNFSDPYLVTPEGLRRCAACGRPDSARNWPCKPRAWDRTEDDRRVAGIMQMRNIEREIEKPASTYRLGPAEPMRTGISGLACDWMTRTWKPGWAK